MVGALDGLRMGNGHAGRTNNVTHSRVRALRLTSRREGDWRQFNSQANGSTYHDCVMKSQGKLWTPEVWWSCLAGEHIRVVGGQCALKTWELCLQNLLRLCCRVPFFGWS